MRLWLVIAIVLVIIQCQKVPTIPEGLLPTIHGRHGGDGDDDDDK